MILKLLNALEEILLGDKRWRMEKERKRLTKGINRLETLQQWKAFDLRLQQFIDEYGDKFFTDAVALEKKYERKGLEIRYKISKEAERLYSSDSNKKLLS